jgi:hypothetical protein
MSDAPEWKNMADWSDLPDVYVTKVECQQGMFWRVEACSVPMIMAPEVRLIRADVSAARIAELERQLAEARTDADLAVAVAYQLAADAVKGRTWTGTEWADDLRAARKVLALVPADALAEVERMRREIEVTNACNNGLGRLNDVVRKRAEAAGAEVARMREALISARKTVYQSSIDRTQPEDAEAALRLIDAALKGDTP